MSVLRLTAKQIQDSLSEGKTSCMSIVDLYLTQIQKHNQQGMMLNAIIEIAPRSSLQKQADVLDAERRAGKLRSKLHGTPIVVKDNICTPSLGMRTTLGSYAFRDCMGSVDGVVIERLTKAGLIVIGKANLSELGNMKGEAITSGWSPLGGQTQSPYVAGGVTADAKWLGQSTPMGSSSGSAVSVAAGFSPISIGTETDGSVSQPATRAALYAMKATCETIDGRGMQAAAPSMDSVGGFAKTTADLAALMSVITENDSLAEPLSSEWHDLSIGLLDPEKWQFPEFYCEPDKDIQRQTIAALYKACGEIWQAGGRVVNAELPLMSDIWTSYDVVPEGDLMAHEIRKAFEHFLKEDLVAPVETIHELISFNKHHADVELPPGKDNQKVLENAVSETMTDEEHAQALPKTRAAMRDAVGKALSNAKVDVLAAPGDSLFPSIAATAGYPIANVPLGFVDGIGRAHGVFLIAPAHNERKLLEVMSAWEATFPRARKPPPLLEE